MMPEVDRKPDTQGSPSGRSNVSRAGAQPIADNPQQRLKWIAHLEFAQSDGAKKGILCIKYTLNNTCRVPNHYWGFFILISRPQQYSS